VLLTSLKVIPCNRSGTDPRSKRVSKVLQKCFPRPKNLLSQYQPAVPPIVDEQEEQEQEVTFAHPEVSEVPEVPEDDAQYDTDSGPDDAVESDNDDDTLTFLKAVTTRSGRAVQVRHFS